MIYPKEYEGWEVEEKMKSGKCGKYNGYGIDSVINCYEYFCSSILS